MSRAERYQSPSYHETAKSLRIRRGFDFIDGCPSGIFGIKESKDVCLMAAPHC
jgi:hypothetical protein